jgi:integrase
VASSLKTRVVLSLGYGCGLRAREIVRLKVKHIDSAQKIIRIEQSKGRNDRNVMLPDEMLGLLRQWWKARPSRHDAGIPPQERWLFPSRKSASNPITTAHLDDAAVGPRALEAHLPPDVFDGAAQLRLEIRRDVLAAVNEIAEILGKTRPPREEGAFSIAITAWSAKVVASSISLVVKGSTCVRLMANTPISSSPRSSGTPSTVR